MTTASEDMLAEAMAAYDEEMRSWHVVHLQPADVWLVVKVPTEEQMRQGRLEHQCFTHEEAAHRHVREAAVLRVMDVAIALDRAARI